MEMMSRHTSSLLAEERIRPLKRIEYDKLAADGFFEHERVELLFGMVVEMPPIDPAHNESVSRIGERLSQQLGQRALVRTQSSFAASEVSEPEPDVFVVPRRDYWTEHPDRAFLIVEIARTSLADDRGPKALLYGLAHVHEYWVIDHVHGVVEVHRDRVDGGWRSITVHGRGETVAMLAFPDVELAVTDILPPRGT
jgi:Uma2 family endonuclease